MNIFFLFFLEKQRKNKKSGICAFFRRAWQAVKCIDRSRHRGNKVAPLQPETDPADPQSTAVRDPADQQPGSSGLESMAVGDPVDPQPGPVPSACGRKPTSDTDPAGPEPTKGYYYSSSFQDDLNECSFTPVSSNPMQGQTY